MKRRDFATISLFAIGGILTKAISTNPLLIKSSSRLKKSNAFFVTTTTFFPYPMSNKEFRTHLQKWKNNESSFDIILDMKKEGKILNYDSKFYNDKIVACFEFSNKDAWNDYNLRFSKIPNNSQEIKKQLGFTSKKEFKKTSFA